MIGTYPDLSVAQAHGKAADVHLAARTRAPIVGVRAEARAKAANRSDAEQAVIAAAEDAQCHSFSVLSEVWLEVRKKGWTAESYRKAVYVVRTYLQPKVGRLDCTAPRSDRQRPDGRRLTLTELSGISLPWKKMAAAA